MKSTGFSGRAGVPTNHKPSRLYRVTIQFASVEKVLITMRHKYLISRLATGVVMAGIVSAPIISAPLASADPLHCDFASITVTVCHTDGSSSMRVVPSTQAAFSTPYFPLDRGLGRARALR